MNVDAEALRGGRVPPDDGVVPDDRAGRMVGSPENRVVAAASEVDDGASVFHVVGSQEDGVDPECLVQQRPLALDPKRIVRVRQPEQPARGEQEIEVELRRKLSIEGEARLEERNRLRGLVVRAQDGRVSTRAPGADVRALEDGDVADPVATREVVRDRQPVSPAADHDHVVAPPKLGLPQQDAPAQESAHRPSRSEHVAEMRSST